MRVHVDGLHAAAVYHHLAAPGSGLRMRMCPTYQLAADKGYAGHGAGHATDEVPACGHLALPCRCFGLRKKYLSPVGAREGHLRALPVTE
jgi:hypothetical protein